ncbi:hypothetical protein [Legionella waltersii]|uniref:Periplasmic ligand-binding sensor domain protein n=1 Tax=Legionella waltersii TaxID=66969 RepID=A0A0W1AAH8_9GAMM|nr:hypothetical protein [Legionella waltersii]KTD78358.1 periplasmic ligand-binding sensor domain protein [Legionella waltersii]SNV06471.1 Uncharacterised protein [Legionella waltersii]
MQAKKETTTQTSPQPTMPKQKTWSLFPQYLAKTPVMTTPLAEYKPLAWDFLNFMTKASVISGAIVSVQSPIKTILVKGTQSGKLTAAFTVPATSATSFPFQAVVKSLYAGTFSGLKGSLMRTAYVTNVKGSSAKSEEHAVEPSAKTRGQFPFLFWSAVGESLVTGRSNSVSQLQKLGILTPANMEIIRFRFNKESVVNNAKLMSTGFAAKTSKSLLNLYFLCVLEEIMANKITFGPESSRHLVSGVMTGFTATMFSFPFDYYADIMQGKTTVQNRKLQSPYSFQVLGSAAKEMFLNPYGTSRYFFTQYFKQVPVRAVLTGAIFGIISSVSDVLGEKPAENMYDYAKSKRVTFFGSKDSDKPVATPTPLPVLPKDGVPVVTKGQETPTPTPIIPTPEKESVPSSTSLKV